MLVECSGQNSHCNDTREIFDSRNVCSYKRLDTKCIRCHGAWSRFKRCYLQITTPKIVSSKMISIPKNASICDFCAQEFLSSRRIRRRIRRMAVQRHMNRTSYFNWKKSESLVISSYIYEYWRYLRSYILTFVLHFTSMHRRLIRVGELSFRCVRNSQKSKPAFIASHISSSS